MPATPAAGTAFSRFCYNSNSPVSRLPCTPGSFFKQRRWVGRAAVLASATAIVMALAASATETAAQRGEGDDDGWFYVIIITSLHATRSG